MKNLITLFFILITFSLFSQGKTQNILLNDIDSNNLSKLIKFSDSTYADEIMIIYKNQIIKHWKSKRCNDRYFNTASMLKSWTGLVIGIMVDRGLIKNENDLICDYLPEWKDGCDNKVTIKNLLTMTAGFKRRSGIAGILPAENAKKYAINSKLDTIPNVKFGYSNVSVQLLGVLIEKLSKKSSAQYFEEVLFKPLGMDSTSLGKDFSKENYLTYGGAKTTIQDAAQIALLMINKGELNRNQIVSESWVNKSKSFQHKWNEIYGYGYLWWSNNYPDTNVYSAMGDLGKLTFVYPDLDLIFLRQQTCDKTKFRRMEWMSPDFYKLVASIIKKK